MSCIFTERRSPLWTENDIKLLEVSNERVESPRNVQRKANAALQFRGAIGHLGNVENGLKNYTSLSIRDRQGLDKGLIKVQQIIETHRFESIAPRLNKVSAEFDEVKKQRSFSFLFLDIEFLENSFSNPMQKMNDEVPAAYKGLREYFNSIDSSKITQDQWILIDKFEPIYYQIKGLITNSLAELDFVEEGVDSISDKELSEKDLAIVKWDCEVAAQKIETCLGFMSPEDQKKATAQLNEIKTLILSFESRTSPKSIVDSLGL